MPLGFERINERTTRPNALINFIKPLPGPESHVAQDFLERIAAQCFPIMKRNYIAVMALEEYAFNTEFIGRNFNAGEVIQLVLKARDGSWMPFRHVQMVMMHELAHCKQMNHSKAFWAVRNAYADEMKGLWGKGYVGEGLWGRGTDLNSGAFITNVMPDENLLPEHICGGTFRSNRQGRKRKRGGSEKPNLTYAERQQKRILKKFGAGGTALGDDEDSRVKLEAGKSTKSKPRVANSKRGRELRAAAALARFEQKKDEPIKKEEDLDSDTDSDYDWPAGTGKVQTNLTCRSLDNPNGLGFVKVCEDEDKDDVDAMRERMEFLDMTDTPDLKEAQVKVEDIASETEDEDDTGKSAPSERKIKTEPPDNHTNLRQQDHLPDKPKAKESASAGPQPTVASEERNPSVVMSTNAAIDDHEDGAVCSVCTTINEQDAVTCIACMNVLAPDKMPNSWRCESEVCNGSYRNIGDYGRCNVCGAAKP